MAKKKVEPITTLGRSENNLEVQKIRPLFALWQSELTLAEFKILDIYLGRINSQDSEHRTVILKKGEIEKALGVTKISKDDLKIRLKHLMQNVVEIPDDEEDDGIGYVTLFEEVRARKDSYGQWRVTLECTQKAKKYFFNVQNIGYYRYKLRCVTGMKSRYTYVMFNYLESNRFRVTWEADLDELKEILNCDKEAKTSTFKYFNRDVLKKVHKDITENTECRYTYTPVKSGKYVVAIRFTVETLRNIETEEEDPNQMTIEDFLEDANIPLWKTALYDLKFTDLQIDEVESILATVPDYKLPEDTSSGTGALDIRRYHYIQQKVALMKRRDSEKSIKNKFAYFIKMITNDTKEE